MNRFQDLLESLQKQAGKETLDMLKKLGDEPRSEVVPEAEPELNLPYSSEPKHVEEPWA